MQSADFWSLYILYISNFTPVAMVTKRHRPNAKCAEAQRPFGPAGDNIGAQSC